jgi:hypothetical protein
MSVRSLHVVVTVVAAALFVESLHAVGVEGIAAALMRIGWGFATVLLLSGARDVVRAWAWTLTLADSSRLGVWTALRARLAGEALNSLLPMGVIVGEPTKAYQVSETVPFAVAVRGLAVEFAFYAATLVPLLAVGAAAFAPAAGIRLGAAASVLLETLVGGVAVFAVVRLLGRVSLWRSSRPRDLVTILACEILYQLLSVAETYVALLLAAPRTATLASALVLETVSRIVTIFFKMVPLRIGVDEASSSFVAGHVGLDPASGLTLALIRRLRLAFWSGVGLALLAWRRAASGRARFPTRDVAAASIAALLVLCLASGAAAQEAPAVVAGAVAIAGSDGSPLAVPGVTVTLRCGNHEPRTEVTNDQGEYRFIDVPARGEACSIAAALQGFASETARVAVAEGRTATANLQLRLDTLREEVVVRAAPDHPEVDRSPIRVEQVTAEVIQTAPIARDRFQDALPLIPGVVRGPDGLLNISGLRSNQAALTFNSANGTDPVTGEDAIELPIDAVTSIQVRGVAYAPEFGLSAGAVTLIDTDKARNNWDVTVNDLEPRVRRRGGEFKGIESWTPRMTVGGPIVPGKVQVLESAQYEYSQTRVFGLPPFESDTGLQTFETFSRVDWQRSAARRFTASVLVSPRKTTYAGLGLFTPQSAAADIDTHNVLASVSDQMALGAGVFESGASVKRFDATIGPSRGAGPMILTPDGNAGSYFNDQERTSRRAEAFVAYSFTPIGPTHVVKIGGAVTRETFDGTSVSRPVQIVRADRTTSQRIDFVGAGQLDASKTAVRGFAQDAWTVSSRASLLYGVRYDHETIAGGVNVAPRGSLSLVASADGRTVVRGGAGLFYSAVPLNVAGFGDGQRRVVTVFAADGATADSVTPMANDSTAALRAPRSVTWNVEVDRQWLDKLFVRVGYQQREHRDEPIVDAAPQAIVLRTDGASQYCEAQITARYTFHVDDRIVASYTRSSANGNLNDFNTFFGNLQNPVIRPDERGPLSWDAPHRVLIWSALRLPHGVAVFPVLDIRTGFPFSNVDGDRNFVGPRNGAGRYPAFVSLDAQVTKKLRIIGHNATIGLKVFNITDHFNPREYQGNLASETFGEFGNSVGRTFRGKWVFEF